MGQRVTIAVKHYSRQLDENMGVQSRDDLESCSEQRNKEYSVVQ